MPMRARDSNTTILFSSLTKGVEDFSSITKEIRTISASALGGMMQWRKIADMPELFVDAVSLLGIGDYSKPLESGAGYHILKLIDKRGPFVEYDSRRHFPKVLNNHLCLKG
jgi:peptidyl-prolyl cis-trans isomerase SurA